MINVHSDLIRNDLSVMGVDAFAILMCITTHIGPKRTAWPGMERLRKMTGLSKERAYKAIARLIELGHIERKQQNVKGEWGKVVYRVTSKYLAVYMGASEFQMEAESEPLAGNPEYGYPEYGKPEHGNTANISIEQDGSIEQEEVLIPTTTTAARETKKLYDLKDNETDLLNPDAGIIAAKKMAEYYKGEGSGQWEYMGGPMKGETGSRYPDPEAVESVTWDWANSEKNRYLLPYWRMHVGKIKNWITAYKNKNHETTNSTTNGRVQQQRKASAFLSPDERKRRLGLL